MAPIPLTCKVLCILLMLLHTDRGAQSALSTSVPTGKVRGRVFDFDTWNQEFILQGEKIKQVVTIDDDGSYEIDLPPGVYQIVMQSPTKDNEIIPSDNIFRRASFRVNPNTTVIINLSSLRNRVYCTRFGAVLLTVINDRPEEFNYPRPKYDTFWLPSSAKEPRDVVIEYCGKKTLKGSTLYTNATLTHDKLTITATYLRIDKAASLLQASGREVIIEDGSKMIIVKRAKLNLITNQITYMRAIKRGR